MELEQFLDALVKTVSPFLTNSNEWEYFSISTSDLRESIRGITPIATEEFISACIIFLDHGECYRVGCHECPFSKNGVTCPSTITYHTITTEYISRCLRGMYE